MSIINKLFVFFMNFYHITTYKFVEINIYIPSYVYHKIAQSTLQYEHSIKLILH
jgi:hypothetical protein